MTFASKLSTGKVGESRIANYFVARGYSVLPVYEIEQHTGKGPRLFMPKSPVIAPDMLIFKTDKAYWIEAKHKDAFSWYRIGGYFCTGIDLRHYHDYCIIADSTPWPVWLLFLHRGGVAKDSPPSPSGLYGCPIDYLKRHESHRSDKWANGMVYWNIKNLRCIAGLSDVP